MQISATMLGRLALTDTCERCFWLSYQTGDKLPFQRPMPGIFSSIDSYTKRAIDAQFQPPNALPNYLKSLGNLIRSIPPPHFTKFTYPDPQMGVTLRGVPDVMFLRDDETLVIGDYKTARYTESQRSLFPAYEVQLNTYALIAQGLYHRPVSALALLYFEPETEDQHVTDPNNHHPNGFRMSFQCKVVHVNLNPQLVYAMVNRAKSIVLQPAPPPARNGCEDCKRFEEVLRLLQIR